MTFLRTIVMALLICAPSLQASINPIPDSLFSSSDLGLASSVGALGSFYHLPNASITPKSRDAWIGGVESKQDVFGYNKSKFSAIYQHKQWVVGVGAMLAQTSGIYNVADTSSRPSSSSTGSDQYMNYRLSVQHFIDQDVSIGIQAKYFSRQLVGDVGSAISVSAGLNAVVAPHTTIGVAANNAYSTGINWGSYNESVPIQYVIHAKTKTPYGTFYVHTDLTRHRIDTSHKLHEWVEIGSKWTQQPEGSPSIAGIHTILTFLPFKLAYAKDYVFFNSGMQTQDTIGLIIRY